MINLSPKDKKRYEALFEKLDTNSDGKIDINDLVTLFDRHEPSENEALLDTSGTKHSSLHRARRFMSRTNRDESGSMNFVEFVNYMSEQENKLELVFKRIDKDNNNKIGSDELIAYFNKLGIDISESEAEKLVSKVNKSGSLMIESHEWKEYFSLAPIDTIDELIYHWRFAPLIDWGESNTVSAETRSQLWYRNLIAGAVAGGISRTCTAPFDRLKTVMQALGSRKQIRIVSGFQHMLKEGGVLSLWRGNGMNVLKIAPEAALKFACYEELKIMISGGRSEVTVGERFLAGSIAGGMAQTIIYPMELLKTRMVLRKTGEYSSIFDCANKIVQREGIRAFYKGYIPNILGIIPYAGTDLAVYETLKRLYMKKHNIVDNPPIPILLMCGSISTVCGQLVSYPLALVRTRLQAQEVPMDSKERDTMNKLLLRIWQNEGVRGLYRGLLPNIIKVVPAVSISYAVYETMKKRLIDPIKNDSSATKKTSART